MTLGTCSNCGGRVSVPDVWLGTKPPIPTCDSCGATKKQPHGPVIDMQPPRDLAGRRLVQSETNDGGVAQ